MSKDKFEGIDWNRNGKRDAGDRYIEMKILDKINEENEKERQRNQNVTFSDSGCLGQGCLAWFVFGLIIMAILFFG